MMEIITIILGAFVGSLIGFPLGYFVLGPLVCKMFGY